MTKTTRTRHIMATAVAMVGMAAFLAPPAHSAASAPAVINGTAYSQALRVVINIPSAAELRSALLAAGYPVEAMPALDLGRTAQTLVIASNYGEVTKTNAKGASSGWAAPLLGSQSHPKSTTRCDSPTCVQNNSILSSSVKLPAPLDLGTIDIAGALSNATGLLKTNNSTGLVEVSLSLEKLIGSGAALSAIGDALETARTQINGPVREQANASIDQVLAALDNPALDSLDPIREELTHYVTIGRINPIPDLRTLSLLETKILAGQANILDLDKAVGGKSLSVAGVEATAQSKLVDFSAFGGWVTADSIGVKAQAFVNGQKGESRATTNPQGNDNFEITNLNIGGLLGVNLSTVNLARILDPNTLKGTATETLKELGLDGQIENITNAIDLSYNIAGISMEKLKSETINGETGSFASATANTLELTIAPALPKLAKLQAGIAGGGVPKLEKEDFVATGLTISIELPKATASVGSPNVFGECIGMCSTTTGVESNMLLGFLILGLAVGVRKFAFSK